MLISEQNDFILETVSGFLTAGIASQTTCIVIATRGRRDDIAQRLQDSGLDVADAARQGTYIALDAASTLSQFLVNGIPNSEHFFHLIDHLIEHDAPKGRPLRIFGEMTAFLWQQGKEDAALALEKLWNTLPSRFHFLTLLCAYPLESFTEEIDMRQFVYLSSQRSHVFSAESYTLLSNPQKRLQAITLLHQQATLFKTEITKNTAYAYHVEELLHMLTSLKTANEELEQASTIFHLFIAKMSHEFRTGLTSIRGFSELLSREEWGPEEVKEYASYIMADSQRLTHLIEEVLDLERMKLGKVELRWELVDMNALLQQLAEQTQHVTSNHTLVCHLDETLPLVPGDPDKLTQVINNLLSNAVKYSPNGGEIKISSLRAQDALQISIQDQGVGIAAKAQKTIFLPYNRMGSEQTRYIQGIGLGLSVSREIINLHGGTIWVTTAPEHGSIFHFTLPLTRKHSDASSE